jgi:hypothetical protein
MSLAFELPFVAVLAVLALIAVLWVSKLRVLSQPVPLFRTLAIVCLALALANPQWLRVQPGLVVLEDVSSSAGAVDGVSAIQAKAKLRFAGQAGDALPESLEPTQTNIAAALQVAQAFDPTRVLLVSDGNATRGNALESLPDVPVDVLLAPTRENARVSDVLAPSTLTPGATVEATAVLESTRRTKARVTARLNGATVLNRSVTLARGRSSLPFSILVPDEGGVNLEVSVAPEFEQPKSDDLRTLAITVQAPQQVLVVNDPALARLLRGQGFRVREGGTAAVREPLAYSAVFIRAGAQEGTPNALSRAQQELLRRYIEEGGGVMLTGGDSSFGLGGWNRSPLEASLPVASDLRTKVDVPLVAMVMVLDRSLSMVGTGGSSAQKLGLALEGVANVIDLANERDFLGLIVFSDEPKWIFKPTRASESNKLQMIRALDGVEAQGGTIAEGAYRQALQALRASRAAVKHVILLTDGQFGDSENNPNPPNFRRIAQEARTSGITTSTIGVGGDADGAVLRQIALGGGGRFYEALNPDTLPRIFTTEALTSRRALVRQNAPVTLQRHPLATRVRGAPPRAGSYIATTLRSDAEAILTGLDREPVLAVTRKGLGRTAALTVDLNRAGAFTAWVDLPGLLGTVARWLETPEAPYRLQISPDGRTVTVDAVERNQYRNNVPFTVRVGQRTLELAQTAPGRYEAVIPEDASGGIALLSRGKLLERRSLSAQNRELEVSGGQELLRRIAANSGGRVLERLEGYVPARQVSSLALAPWLALLGLLFLMAELAWRRFRT